MKDLIKELEGRLEFETISYNEATAKMQAKEANYHPLTMQLWEERIEALAEAIGVLTKYNEK